MDVSGSLLTPSNPLASMIVEHEETPYLCEAGLYRARAAELRQEAEQTHWPDVRTRVLALANEYEFLADNLERLRPLDSADPKNSTHVLAAGHSGSAGVLPRMFSF
jgi:hypothetical protein